MRRRGGAQCSFIVGSPNLPLRQSGPASALEVRDPDIAGAGVADGCRNTLAVSRQGNPHRITGPQKIGVAPYHYLCDGQPTNCVRQPGTDRHLDSHGYSDEDESRGNEALWFLGSKTVGTKSRSP